MERHPFDALSFGFGVLFATVGVLALTGRADSMPMEWVGPAVAVGIGLLILVAARPRRAPDNATDSGLDDASSDAA